MIAAVEAEATRRAATAQFRCMSTSPPNWADPPVCREGRLFGYGRPSLSIKRAGRFGLRSRAPAVGLQQFSLRHKKLSDPLEMPARNFNS